MVHNPPSNHGIHIHTHDTSNQTQCNMTSSPDNLSLSTSDTLDEELDVLTRLDSFQFFRLGPTGTKCSCCLEQVLWTLNDGIPDVVVNDGPVSLLPELALAKRQQSSRQDPKRRNLNNWSNSRRKRGKNFPLFFNLPLQPRLQENALIPGPEIEDIVRSRSVSPEFQKPNNQEQRNVEAPKNAATAAARKHAAAETFTCNKSLTISCFAAAAATIWSKTHTGAVRASAFTNFVPSSMT